MPGVDQPDYLSSNYGPYAKPYSADRTRLSCPETCSDIHGPDARVAGARFVCSFPFGGSCARDFPATVTDRSDGVDFPANTPGGHASHCNRMAFDVDNDGTVEIIECNGFNSDGRVRWARGEYFSSELVDNNLQVPWTETDIYDLALGGPTPIATVFDGGCDRQDACSTRTKLYDCITGGPECVDINNEVALQCFCALPCTPSPPPAPPPIACDALVENTGLCGPNHGNAMCRYCCSSTGFCGDDDGTGIYCGEGAIRGSSYKLIDPERATCPWKPDPVEFEQYCTVNPMNNKQYCVRLPAGKSMADPVVVRGLQKLFKDEHDHLFDKPPPPPPKPPVEQGVPWVQSTLPYPNRGGAAVAMDPTIALKAG